MGKKKGPSKQGPKLTLAQMMAPKPKAAPVAAPFVPAAFKAAFKPEVPKFVPAALSAPTPAESAPEPEGSFKIESSGACGDLPADSPLCAAKDMILALPEGERRAVVEENLALLKTKPAKDGKANVSKQAAIVLAGAAVAMGPASLAEYGMIKGLNQVAGSKKGGGRAAALECIQYVLAHFDAQALPFFIKLLPAVFAAADSGAAVREAAKAASIAFIDAAQPHDVSMFVPSLLDCLGKDVKVRVRVEALEFIAALTEKSAQLKKAVSLVLPKLAHSLIECCLETNAKVGDVGNATLKKVMGSIEHQETQKLSTDIFQALTDAGNYTGLCVEHLMEVTFVNAIEAPSLSLIVPIIVRGLGERDSVLASNTCMTCCNVFGLVRDPRDMVPFKSLIMAKIKEATEHFVPEVREKAALAFTTIKDAIGHMDDDRIEALNTARTKGIAQATAVLEVVAAHLHIVVRKYIATVASTISADQYQLSRRRIGIAINQALRPALLARGSAASADDEEALEEICSAVAGGLRGRAEEQSVDESQFLLNLRGIILAFGGKVLLKQTDLLIKPGHCYGFVGQNGVGKTTLLTRIAAKDIGGFPQDMKCYYVQHEILSEMPISVLEFMKSSVPAGTSDKVILDALKSVGFTDETMQKLTSDLSGGWRMKTAIARSMMWKPTLLLLDEPTNHLDTSSVEWLTEYVLNLRGNTTVCVVSHMYSFLSDVLTDVVHMKDKRLDYHNYGFKEFQKRCPEIVDGLPSPESTIANAAAQAAQNTKDEAAAKEASAGELSIPEPEETMVKLGDDAYDMNGKRRVVKKKVIIAGRPDLVAIVFPNPGRLDGIRSKTKPVMTLKGARFTYPGSDTAILQDASLEVSLGSRTALLGKNGAGKTTLLKMLVGETDPDVGVGKVWKHHNLRLAYIAQHSMHHLEECVDVAPAVYIQRRFARGMDREIAKLDTMKLTKEEKEQMTKYNEISGVVDRLLKGGKLHYAVTRKGKRVNKGMDDEIFWIPDYNMERQPEYVMKLKRNFDELQKARASGMAIRPTTREEVQEHLAEFGIPKDLADSKIKRLSGGQRSRLVLAAAMWTKPHMIALDEPTNYLDNDTLAALTHALKKFRGAVITISHNQAFVESLCNEYYLVEDGQVKKTTKPVYDHE